MSRVIGAAATRALLDELATTPKPGLVDLDHCGAHRDLCGRRMEASALALESAFVELARAARGQPPSLALREELGAIGRRGERAMLRATGGSNTHRGALWALGLVVAGAASLGTPRPDASAVLARAGALARLPDRFAGTPATHGRIVERRFGSAGARGEAAAGFPHVARLAWPLLRSGAARADVLLALMARVEDSCLLHRGGTGALRVARAGARAALAAGGTATPAGLVRTRALDAALIARYASPGGSADLLAAALLLDAIAR